MLFIFTYFLFFPLKNMKAVFEDKQLAQLSTFTGFLLLSVKCESWEKCDLSHNINSNMSRMKCHIIILVVDY